MLSDEGRKKIWESMPTGETFDGDVLVDAAYALGVERARRVKPLVRSERDAANGFYLGQYGVFYDDIAWFAHFHGGRECEYIGSFYSEESAMAACQQHHEASVLSQLEQP